MTILTALLALLALPLSSSTEFVLDGSQTSYAQCRRWFPSYNSSISLEFLTAQPEGLLLYTDDGGYYDFLELKLVRGGVRLRANFGGGAVVLRAGRNLNDGDWHRVVVKLRPKSYDAIELTLIVGGDASKTDAFERREKLQALYPPSFGHANYSYNSDVYVGGLPAWFKIKLFSLALPSVVFEPKFRGAVRELMYADDPSGKIKRQDVMAYKGVRQSSVDLCKTKNPCRNGGVCISTDNGRKCECDHVDFDGDFCQIAVKPVEVTFTGRGYLSYDMGLDQMTREVLEEEDKTVPEKSIVANRERVEIEFRTNMPEGLIFHTGDGGDHMTLSLSNGGLVLSMRLAEGKLNKRIKTARLNDDQWHKVVVIREAKEVTVSVDGIERNESPWFVQSDFNMLSSSTVLIGGSGDPHHKLLLDSGEGSRENYVGCLRKVEFQTDNIRLQLLRLAEQEHRLMKLMGDVKFGCNPPKAIEPVAFTSGEKYLANYHLMLQGGVVSITRPQAYLELPTWNNSMSGSLALKFRTNEPDGLILFNGGSNNLGQSDFFGLELLKGFLFLHLDLGSGAIKLKASNRTLDDGVWHRIEILRNRWSGTIAVDEHLVGFKTKGGESSLQLSGPLYLGGLDPWSTRTHPSELWTASLRKGFVGCIRDVVINGVTIDVADIARKQGSGSVRTSCHVLGPQCVGRPCMNGGRCTEGWNRYICQCSRTSFTGPTCRRPATTVHFSSGERLRIYGIGSVKSEADDLTLRFRTIHAHALLFATRDDGSADRMELALDGGRLRLSLHMGSTRKTVMTGERLEENLWHTLELKRRGPHISLSVDEEPARMVQLEGNAQKFLRYSTLHLAAIVPGTVIPASAPDFEGHMRQLQFNGKPYLELIRSGEHPDHNMTGDFNRRDSVAYHSVTFLTPHTFVGLPPVRAKSHMSLHFMFKTYQKDGLLLFNPGSDHNIIDGDFVAIELSGGEIRYSISQGGSVVVIEGTAPKPLNDNRWHTVAVNRPSSRTHTLMIDDLYLSKSTSPVKTQDQSLHLGGLLFLGGVRKEMYDNMPEAIKSTHGFKGCLASLDLNGDAPHPIDDALIPSMNISEKCEAAWEDQSSSSFSSSSSSQSHPSSLRRAHCACANSGVCALRQNGAGPGAFCDCHLTSFTGPTCSDESVAYEWKSPAGVIVYNHPSDKRPDTGTDSLSLAFITLMYRALLFRVDSQTKEDFLEVALEGGRIKVRYNLGSREIEIGEYDVTVNDGRYHVLKFTRTGANATLQVDDNKVHTREPDESDQKQTVLNDQSRLQLGGQLKPNTTRIERGFVGVMAGVFFNGLRPLDRAANLDPETRIHGDVYLLKNIPFDYRKRNPGLKMQRHNPSTRPEPRRNDHLVTPMERCPGGRDSDVDPNCFTFTGEGDELMTPVLTPTTKRSWHRPESRVDLCDDDNDDDDCLDGSGEEDHGYPSFHTNPPSTPTTTEDLFHFGETTTSTTHPPPPPSTENPPVTERRFDEKTNYYETYPDEPLPGEDDPVPAGGNLSRGNTAPSMILVIGIIVAAVIAITLIVVIVLKARTRVDEDFKVDDARTYQFGSAGGDEFEPLPAAVVATGGGTLLRPTSPNSASNGFYSSNTTNNNMATIITKKSKPIREWYV